MDGTIQVHVTKDYRSDTCLEVAEELQDRLAMAFVNAALELAEDRLERGSAVDELSRSFESARQDLMGLLNQSAHGRTVPLTMISRDFDLAPIESQIVAMLYIMEIDSEIERRMKTAVREEFLSGLSARNLCRVLSGTGRLESGIYSALSSASPLVRYGIVQSQRQSGGQGGSSGLSRTVWLADDVMAFLMGLGAEEIAETAGGRIVQGKSSKTVTSWAKRAVNLANQGLRVIVAGAGGAEMTRKLSRAFGERPVVMLSVLTNENNELVAKIAGCSRVALMAGAPLCIEVGAHISDVGTSAHYIDGENGRLTRSAAEIASVLNRVDVPVVVIAERGHERAFERVLDNAATVDGGVSGVMELVDDLMDGVAASGEGAFDADDLMRAVRAGVISDGSADEMAREIVAKTRGYGDRGEALSRIVKGRASDHFNGLASRLETSVRWEDLVLPSTTMKALREIEAFARNGEKVMEEWGFREKMAYGRSLTCIFSGPSGTGKTLAGNVLANELGLDIFRVDLSAVVSKWVGETEKALSRLFEAASRGRSVILFDEADSLFGKRSEVKTSNDRYSNMETDFLLQKLEEFQGIAILTTNFPENIDPAFSRRIRFKVAFMFPDAEQRADLWAKLIPAKAPREGDLGIHQLARDYDFSGGNIQNAILRAAFRAAGADRGMRSTDLSSAASDQAVESGILVRA